MMAIWVKRGPIKRPLLSELRFCCLVIYHKGASIQRIMVHTVQLTWKWLQSSCKLLVDLGALKQHHLAENLEGEIFVVLRIILLANMTSLPFLQWAHPLGYSIVWIMEDMNWQMNAVKDVNAVSGTGIKVRTRQPQACPHADNFVAQGTAPRRLRLQTKFSTANSGNGEESDSSHKEDKDEVQSAVTEATDATEENPVSDELLEESQPKNSSESRENVEKCSPHLRSRVKQKIPDAASAKSVCSSTSLYICGLLLVLVFVPISAHPYLVRKGSFMDCIQIPVHIA